jgi:hypothetical protein
MIVHDLSIDAVSKMIRSDLAGATEEPPSQIEPFDSTAASVASRTSSGGRLGSFTLATMSSCMCLRAVPN